MCAVSLAKMLEPLSIIGLRSDLALLSEAVVQSFILEAVLKADVLNDSALQQT